MMNELNSTVGERWSDYRIMYKMEFFMGVKYDNFTETGAWDPFHKTLMSS